MYICWNLRVTFPNQNLFTIQQHTCRSSCLHVFSIHFNILASTLRQNLMLLNWLMDGHVTSKALANDWICCAQQNMIEKPWKLHFQIQTSVSFVLLSAAVNCQYLTFSEVCWLHIFCKGYLKNIFFQMFYILKMQNVFLRQLPLSNVRFSEVC